MNDEQEKLDRGIAAIRERMESIQAPSLVVESFVRQYRKLVTGHSGLIDRTMMSPLNELRSSDTLNAYSDQGKAALARCVMIKLNGGLGTSMGLHKAKSLLPVRNGMTFLDILIGQIDHIRKETGYPMPLVLMNSFSTQADTVEALMHHPELESGQQGIPATFQQHQVPKIRQDNLLPVEWPDDPAREWCPPGHADIYQALVTSGMLDALLQKGFEYAFVSNTDNLGATMSTAILGYFAENNVPFLMEVTERTEADKKGGHIARLKDGHLVLRELAQCPENEIDEFQDIQKCRYFNTNNLWINLKALKRQLDKDANILDLPLIINRKTVDPANDQSPAVYQLEAAMGSAIQVFADAEAINVPRTRFSPVKTTNDLLALWSDAYILTDDMRITLHPDRKGEPVDVRLDPAFYRRYQDLAERFPDGAPSMIACESLKVEGDVRFGKNIVLRGDVVFHNPDKEQRLVPDGTEASGNP